MSYEVINAPNGKIIKAWITGVPVEEKALEQLKLVAALPFIYKWVAAMPDVHWGIGATVGTVLPTQGAVVPAAVGVDIGCGMAAVKTNLFRAEHLPAESLPVLRAMIEARVPMGRGPNRDPNAVGAWKYRQEPDTVVATWRGELQAEFEDAVCKAAPELARANTSVHLGTLGTGNHFIEVCVEPADQDRIWILLHSGSRGVGNQIGNVYIKRAKALMEKFFITLPDSDLAYLPHGTPDYDNYLRAVHWAQRFAFLNRQLMLAAVQEALERTVLRPVTRILEVNTHHNYTAVEMHFGQRVLVTRKGAVRAQDGDWGIIPGSMGARSYIVRGKGCRDSFCSCSHGAGRAMGRREAERRFTVEDHVKATEGVECIKDARVLDETPAAYKSIDAVMAAQEDLVEPVHTLKQIVCAKGVTA